jgi:hypothetical protein
MATNTGFCMQQGTSGDEPTMKRPAPITGTGLFCKVFNMILNRKVFKKSNLQVNT